MNKQMSPVRLQAEALREQRWRELEERLPDLDRIMSEGPSYSDLSLLVKVLVVVSGDLHLRVADRLRLEEQYDSETSDE